MSSQSVQSKPGAADQKRGQKRRSSLDESDGNRKRQKRAEVRVQTSVPTPSPSSAPLPSSSSRPALPINAGRQERFYPPGSLVVAEHETIRGSNLTCMVQHCLLHVDDSFIQGNGNRVIGTRCQVEGFNNLFQDSSLSSPASLLHFPMALAYYLMLTSQQHPREQRRIVPERDIEGHSETLAALTNLDASSSSHRPGPASSGGQTESGKDAEQKGSSSDKGVCVICQEEPARIAIFNCGHLCLGPKCYKNSIARLNGKCPVCRGPIAQVKPIFMV